MSRQRARLIALIGLLVLNAAVLALAGGPGASAQAPDAPQRLVLRVGDSVEVPDARIGCVVTTRDSRVAIECRRAGSVARTYGTVIDDRRVAVARFVSSRRAQEILTARHGGDWRVCKTPKTAARAADRGCR